MTTESRVEFITRHLIPEHVQDQSWPVLQTAWPIAVARAREIERGLRDVPDDGERKPQPTLDWAAAVEAICERIENIPEYMSKRESGAFIRGMDRVIDEVRSMPPLSIAAAMPEPVSGDALEVALDAWHGIAFGGEGAWRRLPNAEAHRAWMSRALAAAFPALTVALNVTRFEVERLKSVLEKAENQQSIALAVMADAQDETAILQARVAELNAMSPATAFPWESDRLKEWSIVGMNHYRQNDQRCIFVSMERAGRVIKAEGPDYSGIWSELERQALLTWDPPGHTDLMVSPESIDRFMKDNPLPNPIDDAEFGAAEWRRDNPEPTVTSHVTPGPDHPRHPANQPTTLTHAQRDAIENGICRALDPAATEGEKANALMQVREAFRRSVGTQENRVWTREKEALLHVVAKRLQLDDYGHRLLEPFIRAAFPSKEEPNV